jgi:hypothetical protein
MRRGAGTIGLAILAAAVVDSAAIAGTAPAPSPLGASPACGVGAARSITAAEAAGASATGGATTTGGLTAIFSSRAAGGVGGFTTTPAGGGATTTTGRAAAATPAGGFATTAPTGGREAIAGVEGGAATIGGADRGCGTILRGSGLGGAAGIATIGAATAGAAGFGGVTASGLPGTRAWRASSSSSLFLAWIALSTSPGLEMCERSILGATGSAPWRACAPPPCDAVFASCAKCARTFSASSSSSELECVFPAETPIPGRTSRIARDLTSSSFARSLIRTLLIRLFSVCAA